MDSSSEGIDKSLSLQRALPSDRERWDSFVDGHPEGRFCHLWGYGEILKEVYGYRCLYVKIHLGQEQVGVFPSVIVSHGRPRLVSQPFNEYGGPLTYNFSVDRYERLGELLFLLSQEEKSHSIEIRGGVGCELAEQAAGWVRKPLHFYAILNLADPKLLWRDSLTNEARKGVNRGRKAGLSVEIRRGEQAVGDPFYELYLVSMKRLGVPPHPARFFTQLASSLGERVVAAWIMSGVEPAAILLGIVTGQRIQIWITASNPKHWSSRPNDLAHWELISWSYAQGLRVFDFGSARYVGQIQFKKKWGANLREYSYYLIGPPAAGSSLEIQTVGSSSKTMEVMSTIWRTIVPLRLTPVLGPPIRKDLTK
jgi:hypothetical protein